MAAKMSNLLKLSFIVRKLTVISNNAVRPIRFFPTSTHRREGWLKGEQIPLSNSQLATTSYHHSQFTRQIRECITPSRVFHITNQYGDHINGHETVEALDCLYRLNKVDSTDNNNISTSHEFRRLCNVLESKLTELPVFLVIKSLRILNHFHGPISTPLIEKLLKITSESVNDMSLVRMLYLSIVLRQCEKTPMVAALTSTLSMIIKPKINSQLDAESIDNLILRLHYIHSESDYEDSLPIILDAINKVDESLIRVFHAKSVMAVISSHELCDNTAIEVLRKCQRVLLVTVENATPRAIIRIANSMAPQNETCDLMYNDILLDACATTVVSKDMGLLTATDLLKACNNLCHTHNSLLDYIAAKCFEDKETARLMHMRAVQTIICGMSLADYKPVFWEALKDTLLVEELLTDYSTKLLNVGIHLATIDCYWPKILDKIFRNEEIRQLPELRFRLVLLIKAVQLYYPEYKAPLIPEDTNEIIESSAESIEQNPPMKSALECALGGPQYIIDDLRCGLIHNIDHVVIMKKGGFPIALNNSEGPIPSNIEDLKPPQDSQVLLFKYIPKFGCAHNTQRLTGYWSLIIRTLKAQTNFNVIPIPHVIWCKLNESERTRYISQAIRLKSDELSAVVNQ